MSQYPECKHGHSNPAWPCPHCELEDTQRKDREYMQKLRDEIAALRTEIAALKEERDRHQKRATELSGRVLRWQNFGTRHWIELRELKIITAALHERAERAEAGQGVLFVQVLDDRDALRARLEAMRGALEEAEQTFLNYAAMHDAKQPPATQKAKSNRQAAARCRAALASEATNSTRKEGEPCAAPVPTITTPATKVAPSTEAASDGAPSSDPTDAPEVALPNMPCQICGGSGYITHGPNGGICSDCHGSGLLRPQPADGACDAARRKAAGKETL